jgi:SpoVK/Ycf46/Vps4 family AAA+-type ATPase
MGHFLIKAKKKLSDLPIGERIEESDFASILPDGSFVQLEYIESEDKIEPYKVKPGIWAIQKTAAGLKLESTSFSDDKLLNEFVHTENITNKINSFFTRLHVYAKHGIEVPKRAMLLYGPAGTGKTSASLKIAKDYIKDGKTAVLVWATDKIDPYDVKDFFKSFEYVGVEKIILIMEDIGGVEVDQVRMKSTSSLLSLLDNQEKAFKIATFIIATTNHPENFLGNLTNRPGRFDDKVSVEFPNGEQRSKLLAFFMTDTPDDGVLEMIKNKKYAEFSPAHLKEVVIRSDLYGITLMKTVEEIQKEIDLFKKAFEKNKGKLGIEYED